MSNWLRSLGLLLVGCLIVPSPAFADPIARFVGSIGPAEADQDEAILHVDLPAAEGLSTDCVPIVTFADETIQGRSQIVGPDLISAGEGNRPFRLCLSLSRLKAGQKSDFRVVVWGKDAVAAPPDHKPFVWADFAREPTDGEPWRETAREVRVGDRPILRFMNTAPIDGEGPAHDATFKVFHHVFDQADGLRLTKGYGGLFPHHRGLFYGFNKIAYGDKSADIWHCNHGETQVFAKTLVEEGGPLLARHVVELDWNGKDGRRFAREIRETTVYRKEAGSLIDFASRLESDVGPIDLKGDPQHAGFQFRATQQVPDLTAKRTYYVRPDGVGKPGEFRNWPDVKTHVDLPWHAMVMFAPKTEGDAGTAKPYTVCRLEFPGNPKETRHSERDYGRFGAYFEATLDKDRPLTLRHRVSIDAAELDVAAVERRSRACWSPAPVSVKLEGAGAGG